VRSLGAENPELVFESLAACAGVGQAAVRRASKFSAPNAIHDLFEHGLTAIEVVVDWLTAVLAVEGAFFASQLLRAGGISRPAFNMAPYVPFAVATLVVLLLDRDGAYRAGNSLLRIEETERSLRVAYERKYGAEPNYARLMTIYETARGCYPARALAPEPDSGPEAIGWVFGEQDAESS
jgi:hypothetical protein